MPMIIVHTTYTIIRQTYYGTTHGTNITYIYILLVLGVLVLVVVRNCSTILATCIYTLYRYTAHSPAGSTAVLAILFDCCFVTMYQIVISIINIGEYRDDMDDLESILERSFLSERLCSLLKWYRP
jgi:hypothetical protein